ncbi:MAG TPA: saccharopine dehydrogenase NADP-binding domain-containing protein [Pirellulales bacterium]|nr:saccharopine dehydrogenase NADP-binding domain-containing protein [Pirellulales bacterium]
MSENTWLIYGANGYTGRLIAAEAKSRRLSPLLAGRDAAAVEKLSNDLGLASRSFALDDVDEIVRQLAGVTLVLNCAGPFCHTAPLLIEACLRGKTHYLDITGEIDVIELAAALDGRAREAGISVIPAVGFDVVPSDCLAAMLAEKLPTATHLVLAFTASGSVSPGTAKTLLEVLPGGGRARIDGEIRRVPADWKWRTIPFPSGVKEAVTIPWGDVASAYYSTGIRNIETYLAASARLTRQSRWLRRIAWLLRSTTVRRLAQRFVARNITGPTADERAGQRAELWGEVSDAAGNHEAAVLETPDGYTLTVTTALAAVAKVLSGQAPTGFSTPSKAFGKDFVLTLPGTRFL